MIDGTSNNTGVSFNAIEGASATAASPLNTCAATGNTTVMARLKEGEIADITKKIQRLIPGYTESDISSAVQLYQNCNTTDLESVLAIHAILKKTYTLTPQQFNNLIPADILLHGHLSNKTSGDNDLYLTNVKHSHITLKEYRYIESLVGHESPYEVHATYFLSQQLKDGGVRLLVSLKDNLCNNPYPGENAIEVSCPLSAVLEAKAKIYQQAPTRTPAIMVVLPENMTIPCNELVRSLIS